MIPVPPPLRFEFGTGRSAVPLKVTEVMLASVVVVSSMATPTTRMRSVPPPMAWVQDRDVRPVEVVAARLAASKEIAAAARPADTLISPAARMAVKPALDWSLFMIFVSSRGFQIRTVTSGNTTIEDTVVVDGPLGTQARSVFTAHFLRRSIVRTAYFDKVDLPLALCKPYT